MALHTFSTKLHHALTHFKPRATVPAAVVGRGGTLRACAQVHTQTHSGTARTRFANKSIIVTGGANGIGQAIVEAFCAEGGKVVFADVDDTNGHALVSRMRSRVCVSDSGSGHGGSGPVAQGPSGTDAGDGQVGGVAAGSAGQAAGRAAAVTTVPTYIRADVSRESEVVELVAEAARLHGGVDVLVNNAAKFVFGEVTEVTAEDWDRVLAVNIKGYAFMMKYAIPRMRERGGGAIVNLSSISAMCAQAGFVPYSMTKAGVLQMTRNVAMDCAKYGIRVNAVCPGAIRTEATDKHAALHKQTVVRHDDDLFAEITQHVIIKRMGKPSEVARAVLFLASDEEASYITGSHIMVDGGYAVA